MEILDFSGLLPAVVLGKHGVFRYFPRISSSDARKLAPFGEKPDKSDGFHTKKPMF